MTNDQWLILKDLVKIKSSMIPVPVWTRPRYCTNHGRVETAGWGAPNRLQAETAAIATGGWRVRDAFWFAGSWLESIRKCPHRKCGKEFLAKLMTQNILLRGSKSPVMKEPDSRNVSTWAPRNPDRYTNDMRNPLSWDLFCFQPQGFRDLIIGVLV